MKYIPFSVIPRLVRDWPEAFLDGKYWDTPYAKIKLKNVAAMSKLRREEVDRMYNMLMDALWLAQSRSLDNTLRWKESVLRAKHSLNLLEIERAKDE